MVNAESPIAKGLKVLAAYTGANAVRAEKKLRARGSSPRKFTLYDDSTYSLNAAICKY